MVQFFYKTPQKEVINVSGFEFGDIAVKDVMWIDLFEPTGEEKRAVEAYLQCTIQSRAQAEEIESSSRYSENDVAIYANTNFLIPGPEDIALESVSFMYTQGVLTTIRESPLRSFTELQRRLIAFPAQYIDGFALLLSILENRTDLDADIIELMSKEIAQYNKKVSLGEDINEELLLDINQLQENAMIVRENVMDKQRVLSSLLKSPKRPKRAEPKLNILLKDINSLISNTNFAFERLEYLQNTVVGLINLEQNKIMKVFTLVSLLLMPPTLITSFFGMNVQFALMDRLGEWAWPIIFVLMIISFVVVLFAFIHKKML